MSTDYNLQKVIQNDVLGHIFQGQNNWSWVCYQIITASETTGDKKIDQRK